MSSIKVDAYLKRQSKWAEETIVLHQLMVSENLYDDIKWGKPTYLFENKNLAIIQPFKDYIALMFFKGVLLEDKNNLLFSPGENSQTARQLRFHNVQEINDMKNIIKQMVEEAKTIERLGVKAPMNEKAELIYPDELISMFDEDFLFRDAFESLTPGRKRAYNMYFTQAKQSITRYARIEKYKSKILDGKGLND